MVQLRRSLRGVFSYPIGLIALASTSPLYRDDPRLLWSLTGCILAGILLRCVLAWYGEPFYQNNPRRWRLLFSVTVVLISVPVGLVYAVAIGRYGLAQWTFTAALIWTSFIGAVSLVTFIPRRVWAYLQLLPVFVPAILISFWLQQEKTVALGVALFLFLAFLLAQLQWLHTTYRQQMADRALGTERLREVELAKLAAEAANEAKTRFLANVSHELRTPIHGVLGMTELVLNTALTAEQQEYLFALRRSASGLLGTVNDLLDVSKLEAEKTHLDSEVFNIRSTIEDVRITLVPKSDAKRIRLETIVDSEVPAAIVGDSLRLRQVLVNLGDNAIKFTDSGFARLRVHFHEFAGSNVQLGFFVEDSGIGIRDENRARIFEPFSQADASITRRFGGTGLGLSIASQLVELMGGEIVVESQPGMGSIFSFCCTFPVGVIAEPLPRQPAAHPLAAGLNILVAEDNKVSQLLAVRLLEAHGHFVTVAATGQEDVNAVSSQTFDLILMDNQMPELSGIEATIRVREMGYTLPIVALSASAMPGDRERFLAAGMNGCLAKPVQAE